MAEELVEVVQDGVGLGGTEDPVTVGDPRQVRGSIQASARVLDTSRSRLMVEAVRALHEGRVAGDGGTAVEASPAGERTWAGQGRTTEESGVRAWEDGNGGVLVADLAR
ncbi:MAG: hypothetical protein EA352_08265 [Gemmatimonadales bacterium]|nr:MAG: hypothetical protein EA352_08265 [Gemmatimonadales bacterium]